MREDHCLMGKAGFGIEKYREMGGLSLLVGMLLCALGVGFGGLVVMKAMEWGQVMWTGLGLLGMGGVTLLLLVLWGVRVHGNVCALGVQRLFFEGEWLIWGWLLPGVSGVVLPVMLQELWRASEPEVKVRDGYAWRWVRWSKRIWVLGGLWWVAHFCAGTWGVSWLLVESVQEFVRDCVEFGVFGGLSGTCLVGVVVVWDVRRRLGKKYVGMREYLVAKAEGKDLVDDVVWCGDVAVGGGEGTEVGSGV